MTGLSHYKYIDALRGFAFLCVLTVHASHEVPNCAISGVAEAGQYGVQLFFVLSAVTLMRSMTSRSRSEHFPVRNFFVRRFFRIAPLFWSGIVFYYFVNGCGPQYWAPNGLGIWHFVSTALFLHGWTPTTIDSVVPGGWSIAVEMTFYLCLPLLARWITSAWTALVATFFALIARPFLDMLATRPLLYLTPPNEHYLISDFLTFWFPAQLPVFLLGIATYFILQDEALIKFISIPHRAALLALMGLYGLGKLTITYGRPILTLQAEFAIAFAIIVVALRAHPFRLAVNSATCNLGVISFSCYITHFFAVSIASHHIPTAAFGFLPPRFAAPAQFAAIWIVALPLTAAASTVTYWLIEKPGMLLGSRIIERYESARTAALGEEKARLLVPGV